METFNNLILLTISQSFRWSGKQKTNTPTNFLTVCLFNEGDERYFNKIYFWVNIRKGGGKILIKQQQYHHHHQTITSLSSIITITNKPNFPSIITTTFSDH
jgi:hypothetical protein